MAEYVMNISRKDRWEKMNARTDAIFERIMAKLEILRQLYNCSPNSSHGATNSVKAFHASESLNVVIPTRDEFLPSVEQIKIPSPCMQSLLVDAVTPASDLIEDVMYLPSTTTTITTLTETTELFAGRNISIDQIEYSLSKESKQSSIVIDEDLAVHCLSPRREIHATHSFTADASLVCTYPYDPGPLDSPPLNKVSNIRDSFQLDYSLETYLKLMIQLLFKWLTC
jgi:hypothetical protein